MDFFAYFSVASQASLEYVGQEGALKEVEKGAKSAALEE